MEVKIIKHYESFEINTNSFKNYKKGNILLGNGYLLTAFAVYLILGYAPKPMHRIGGLYLSSDYTAGVSI